MTPCIEHNQVGHSRGYGSAKYMGRNTTLHRVTYMRHHNLRHEDIAGLVIMHICDNPRCYNIDHLKLGTSSDNAKDCINKGRGNGVAARGSAHRKAKLNPEAVAFIKNHYIPYDREFGTRALARRFGVTNATVSNALREVTWRDSPYDDSRD